MAEKKYQPLPLIFKFTRYLFNLAFSLFPKKLNGKENLPESGSFIIAANHSSVLDGFLIELYISRFTNSCIHFIAKEKYYNNPLSSFILETSGAIKLESKEPAIAFLLAQKLLENGEIVGIFPEGTRSYDGKLKQAKRGVAGLALKANVPIVPVGMVNTNKILPRGSFLPKIVAFEINIGKPLDMAEFQQAYTNALEQSNTDKIVEIEEAATTAVMRQIAELSNQSYPA